MQSSFSDLEYAAKKKMARRDRFVFQIEAVKPWAELEALIEPHWPKGAGVGRSVWRACRWRSSASACLAKGSRMRCTTGRRSVDSWAWIWRGR